MNAKRLEALLVKLEACEDAREWARGKTLVEAWVEVLGRRYLEPSYSDGDMCYEAASRAIATADACLAEEARTRE